MIDYQYLKAVPDSLYSAPPEGLFEILKKPTIFKIEGEEKPPLFISCLLHGNELTGYRVVNKLINKYKNKKWPRPVYILIGNIEAAASGLRKLDSSVDYNRIWHDTSHPLVKFVKELIASNDFIAAIDIHNNTGKNPQYACVSQIKAKHLQLANLFSRTMVYFTQPDTALSVQLSKMLPSITIECGLSDEPAGIDQALTFVDACLHVDHLPETLPKKSDYNLYQTIATIKVPKSANVCFEGDPTARNADIILRNDLDSLNFAPLKAGEFLGKTFNSGMSLTIEPLISTDISHSDFIEVVGNEITAKRVWIPSMFTKDLKVLKEDCLGYIMIPIH